MNRQVCAIAMLIFVMVSSCASRFLDKKARPMDANAATTYAWTALKADAETAIKNGDVRGAESKVIQALQIAERELTTDGSVDSAKSTSLDQLVADSGALQKVYERELDAVYKSHRSDATCKSLRASVLKKRLALSFLNLSVMRKYRTSGDSTLRALESANSKLQSAL